MNFFADLKRKLFGNTTDNKLGHGDGHGDGDGGDDGDDNNDNDKKRSKIILKDNITLKDNIEKIKKQCDTGTVAILDTCNLDENYLKTFALTQTILEIYDADHDLNRSKYDKNPLVEYCRSFVGEYPKLVFINNKIIALNGNNNNNDLAYIYNEDNWKSTSQSAIKNNMETVLKDLNKPFLTAFGRIPFTSSITKEEKNLTDLQVSLKNKNLDLTLVETHRGGSPNNVENMNNKSIMLKPSVSTRFDLGSNAILLIKNTDIQPGFCELANNNFNSQNPTSPLCRFFSNYFPNSFTIVIKKSELFDNSNTMFMPFFQDYFKKIGINGVLDNLFTNIEEKKKSNQLFFADDDDDALYLLHMFMDKANNKPTFSIQKGPITADQVTEALYGVKHRCLSSKTQSKLISNSLLILDTVITPNVRFCHILYAKTCGDGVAIEATKMSSKVFRITVNLLSNDVCCNYRNAFVNGFSTRQAPSSLAGTGLGILSNTRNVEIMTMINPTTTTLSQRIEGIIDKDAKDYYPTEPDTIVNNLVIDGIDKHALDDILTCAYRKIYDNEYNNDTKAKQTQISELIKKLETDENLTIIKTDCELLKELCMNDQILFIKTKVDNSFEDFKNRLRNILKKIQLDYPLLIQARPIDDVQIAFTIERGISLVSSLEQLLGEVYPCDNDELGLKKIVLYFLTVVIQKSISATRIITRYIEMLKGRLIQIIKVQAMLNSKDVNHLRIESSYEELLTEFNALFNNFDSNYQNIPNELDRYNRRQQAKQPLNLLKFILRSIEAKNKWENSNYESLYYYIYHNYREIIESSHVESPFATLEVLNKFSQYSQEILSQNSENLFSQLNTEEATEEAKEEINKEASDNLPYSISNMLANSKDAQTIKAMILEYTETSSQEESEEKEKLLNELAKPDLYIIGSKTGESPESMDPFVQQSLPPTSPEKNVKAVPFTTPSQKKTAHSAEDFLESQNQEDDLNVALAAAIDGDIYTDDQNEIGEDEKEDDQEDENTKMPVSSGGKPLRKTKNKRNKITRNKKTKNNQTKKHKRTKRRKVI